MSFTNFVARLSTLWLLVASCAACSPLPSADSEVALAGNANDMDRLGILRQRGEIAALTPFVEGNKVTLLKNGAEAYPAMLHAIKAARSRIDMESFTFDEAEGGQFVAALLRKRAEGVDVNLIYDSLGSADMSPDLFEHMSQSHIHMVEYNPFDVGSILDSSFNHRDHRKLLIVDGKTAFTGGINISAVYRLKVRMGSDKPPHEDTFDPDKTAWRDTHVKIEGPVVSKFEQLFMQTWTGQDGPLIKDPPTTPTLRKGPLLVQAIDGTPDQDRYAIYKSLLVAIALAQHSVHLTTAYFVPTPDLVTALEAAARRGVDVALVVPSISDSDLALKAGHSYYEDLMEAGVRIYERQGAVLHSKTAVIDGDWSMVGSSNLDWRSVLLNDECNAVVLGASFGNQMNSMFADDIGQSHLVDPIAWDTRPMIERFDEWKDALFEYYL